LNKPQSSNLGLAQVGAVEALAGDRPEVGVLLDRYEIAVILNAAYQSGGHPYSNAVDAIAAAKRGQI
jgi:hypothetical protein